MLKMRSYDKIAEEWREERKSENDRKLKRRENYRVERGWRLEQSEKGIKNACIEAVGWWNRLEKLARSGCFRHDRGM